MTAQRTKPKHKLKWYKSKQFYQVLVFMLFVMFIGSVAYFQSVVTEDKAQLSQLKQSNRNTLKLAVYIQYKNPKVWPSLATEIATGIVTAASQHKVPLDILVGLVEHESGFNVFAVSKTNAAGLAQVDFDAWKEEFKVSNKYEPSVNVQCGAWILAKHIHEVKLKKGLQIYNSGIGNYRKGVISKDYVSKVYEYASEYRYYQAI